MVDSNNFYSVFNFIMIAYIPFHIFGFIGNILIIRIVHKTREMHTTTNYLLANLAASDSIIILMSSFYLVCFGHPDFVASLDDDFVKISCKFVVVMYISVTSSAFTLTLLAVERYHAILKPFTSNLRLHEESIKRAIFVIWFLSIVIGFPGFFLVGSSKKYSCIGSSGVEIYSLIYSTFTAYIPTVVFFFCYGSLIKGLYFSGTICAENTNEDNSEKRKLLVTFILATSGFLIGYGPITVLDAVCLRMEISDGLSLKLFYIFGLVFNLILCLNPVLYAFRSSNFKEGFKRVLFSRCLRSSTQQNENQLA
ncbi:somatostatin receptor type 2-like [Montipora capricornis]|uniref:somatostatin receptor type 2-like n=1 Tax=Montipora capricornis TaxID=246305 RepID=UPI0035F11498